MFAADATIDSIMTPARHQVSPDDMVSDADSAMRTHGIHHLVVHDGVRLVGIVSALDVLRVPPDTRPLTSVGAIMTRDVHTLLPTATVREALDRFAAATCSAIPIVDAHGVVHGIVTTTDLEQLLYSDY